MASLSMAALPVTAAAPNLTAATARLPPRAAINDGLGWRTSHRIRLPPGTFAAIDSAALIADGVAMFGIVWQSTGMRGPCSKVLGVRARWLAHPFTTELEVAVAG